MYIFLICGYGIPENIHTDQNYSNYLNTVFNTIFEHCSEKEAVLIPMGGATKCTAPYDGTEGEVMAEYLQELMRREETQKQTALWKVIPEVESLSSLENLLDAKNILDNQKFEGEIIVFCEKTREHRLTIIAKNIFGPNNAHVQAIDFDTSKNRYIDPEILNKKEDLALQESLWTLESPERIALHHEYFVKKLEFLRQRDSEGVSHVNAVHEWTVNQEQFLRELMPDHPLLKHRGK